MDLKAAHHLGNLNMEFESGIIDEESVFNADKTHVAMHLIDGRSLAMKEEEELKLCHIVGGAQGMTVMVTFGGRSK